MRRTITLIAATALAFKLAGCGEERRTEISGFVSPPPTATETITETATPSATQPQGQEAPTASAPAESAATDAAPRIPNADLVLPECPEMNEVAFDEMRAYGEQAGMQGLPMGKRQRDAFDAFAGPVARDLMDASDRLEGCEYVVGPDGARVTQFVAVAGTEQQELIDALIADKGIHEIEVRSGRAFQYEAADVAESPQLTYMFDQNLWVAIANYGGTNGTGYPASALDALYRANEGLAG